MTCKDCRHHLHNYHDKYVCTNKDSDCYGLNTDDDDSCALCESEWIRVEDRLPEPEQEVMVFYCSMSGDNYRVAMFTELAYGWTDGMSVGIPVTHWMPLPEPPEE